MLKRVAGLKNDAINVEVQTRMTVRPAYDVFVCMCTLYKHRTLQQSVIIIFFCLNLIENYFISADVFDMLIMFYVIKDIMSIIII